MIDSRRTFLMAAPTALSMSRVLGANDRIRVGGIGVGGRARLLCQYAKDQGAELVAFSDVYEPRRREAREKLEPRAEEIPDYRRLLERKDIDAVIIGSPDHWHVPMAIDAVRAGKDVYVEKPLTKTVAEGPHMEKAVAESGRVVQVGYQQRSWEHFQAAKEIVASGKLGRIPLVLSSWYQNYTRTDPGKLTVETGKLDWKRWLGSAPEQPVNALRYFRWRWFWDFGGGHLTDLHSHYGDVIHWYMDAYEPRTAAASGGVHILKFLECPDTITAAWEYPGFSVNYSGALTCTLEGGNIVFRGERAMLKINRDGFAVYPEGIVPPEKSHLPEPSDSMRSTRDGTIDHMQNFLDCVRSRKEPNAPVRLCSAAARAAHLANQAYRTGRMVSA
ncbi:MAG: Gfo/Idh/MocA family oxidoreductase [Acidobacteria bacterium]|nr:Gfo/Idh/MocA family oxidoreductase [Acidobacteriota bacterium]